MPRYLQQRHRTWYAVLEIPKSLRRKLGRARYIQSLKTDSLRTAEIRVMPLIAEWKRQIELARSGNDSLEGRVALWRSQAQGHLAEGMTLKEVEELSVDISATLSAEDPEVVTVHELAFNKTHLLSEHLAAYLATQTHLAAKTQDMKASDLRRFVRKFRFAADANRRALIDWVENELMNRDGLTEATCRRIVSNCRGYWDYLERHKGLDLSKPFDRVVPARRASRNARTDARRAFTPADYQKLLKATPERDQSLRDLIMLGAYTGARIEELCSLTLDRVKDHRFEIEDAKTSAGNRTVPIHSSISERVIQMKNLSTDGYLMAGLTTNKYGDRSNAIGKRFGRLKSSLGYGRSYVFHSFRKGVATQLEQNGIPENEAARLLGHELKTMSYGLYADGDLRFERLQEIVDALDWGGVLTAMR